jgi:hypothetical protein
MKYAFILGPIGLVAKKWFDKKQRLKHLALLPCKSDQNTNIVPRKCCLQIYMFFLCSVLENPENLDQVKGCL